MQWRRLKIRWIVLALAGFVYLPSMPAYIMAHSPKIGRVVDTATGKGLPGIFVIAAAEVTSSASFFPETRTATEIQYRVIARTDSNGVYEIPNTWLRVNAPRLIPFIGTTSERWMLTAFEPGYVLADDEAAWNARATRNQKRTPVFNHPPSQWKGYGVEVEPLMMSPVQLTVEDAAHYYGAVARLGSLGTREGLSDEDVLLRKKGSDFFVPQLCSLSPWEKVSWADQMNAFVLDDEAFLRKLDQLEPDSFRIAGEQAKPAIFRADTGCEAMKVGNAIK